jgi:hypothetical protein
VPKKSSRRNRRKKPPIPKNGPPLSTLKKLTMEIILLPGPGPVPKPPFFRGIWEATELPETKSRKKK